MFFAGWVNVLSMLLSPSSEASQQAIVELALRQQLALYPQTKQKPRPRLLDRASWTALHRLWPRSRGTVLLSSVADLDQGLALAE